MGTRKLGMLAAVTALLLTGCSTYTPTSYEPPDAPDPAYPEPDWEAEAEYKPDSGWEDNLNTELSAAWPNGAIGWDEARNNVGTYQYVCGPLVSYRETEWGTFVNVGLDYPNAGRFTFVVWDWYGMSFPSSSTICAEGDIYLYEGVTQMEFYDGSYLEVWN